jgi:hypothetical protein
MLLVSGDAEGRFLIMAAASAQKVKPTPSVVFGV